MNRRIAIAATVAIVVSAAAVVKATVFAAPIREQTTASWTSPYTQSTTEESTSESESYISLGEFRITAYCHCRKCCGKWADKRPTNENGQKIVYTASGKTAIEGMTIAADTDILPFGSTVIIDGNEYTVQDKGSAIKGKCIDIYFESHKQAVEFGVKYKEVLIKKG